MVLGGGIALADGARRSLRRRAARPGSRRRTADSARRTPRRRCCAARLPARHRDRHPNRRGSRRTPGPCGRAAPCAPARRGRRRVSSRDRRGRSGPSGHRRRQTRCVPCLPAARCGSGWRPGRPCCSRRRSRAACAQRRGTGARWRSRNSTRACSCRNSSRDGRLILQSRETCRRRCGSRWWRRAWKGCAEAASFKAAGMVLSRRAAANWRVLRSSAGRFCAA